MSRASFTPSQVGDSNATPLAWTANPFALVWYDIKLFIANARSLWGVLIPGPAHPLDELYPGFMNVITSATHVFLIFYQLLFLASIPLALICFVPAAWLLIYCALALGFNRMVCLFLNGPAVLDSKTDLSMFDSHPNERWLFLNGVSVGSHWLQSNIDRLSLTFKRPLLGIHNATDGIVFDLIQCLIERNFSYSTEDVREAYVQIKAALIEEKYEKIVLILHSQGGIQGSLIVDWLLSEVPQPVMNRLEIYTFGNAANHFNNPHADVSSYRNRSNKVSAAKSVGYIEHYGNAGDFVARWGILNFTKFPNRYMGRVFERPGNGHLLNQHYLTAMFPLGPDDNVLEKNDFMEMAVNVKGECLTNSIPATSASTNGSAQCGSRNGLQIPGQDERLLGMDRRGTLEESLLCGNRSDESRKDSLVADVNSPIQAVVTRESKTLRVKDFSRLWQYRNGKSPPST